MCQVQSGPRRIIIDFIQKSADILECRVRESAIYVNLDQRLHDIVDKGTICLAQPLFRFAYQCLHAHLQRQLSRIHRQAVEQGYWWITAGAEIYMKRLGALSQSRTVENINDPNMKARGNETNDWRSLEKEIIELAVTGNKLSEIKKQLKLIYDLLYEEGITVKGERFVLINNSIQRLCKLMDEVTGLPLRRAFRIIRRNLDEALR